jgi:hypothetical protein
MGSCLPQDTFGLNFSNMNVQTLIQFGTIVEQLNLVSLKWLCISPTIVFQASTYIFKLIIFSVKSESSCGSFMAIDGTKVHSHTLSLVRVGR